MIYLLFDSFILVDSIIPFVTFEFILISPSLAYSLQDYLELVIDFFIMKIIFINIISHLNIPIDIVYFYTAISITHYKSSAMIRIVSYPLLLSILIPILVVVKIIESRRSYFPYVFTLILLMIFRPYYDYYLLSLLLR